MNRIHKLIENRVFKYSLLILLTTFLGCNNSEEQTVATFTNLVMGDDFDTDGMPDSSKWTYDIGTGTNGWGNNELQYYTNDEKNVTVQNGVLIISAEKEDFNGSGYTSARIKTQGLFDQTYGRFEARIKMPYGQGIWPAFWLLGSNIDTVGWPQCGELDIMEFRGQEPTVIHGSMHGPGYSAGESVTKSYTLENDRFDTGFHVFGIEWGPDYVNYYVDNVLYNQITREDVTGEWVFDQPFFIIINLAVGGDFLGAPDASTVFPQRMLIDYVRVYKQ
ncbi:glycoside hydrolase family 16 protein [Tenacibaculum xiamenense]|uniref:glycoside hydrolase family 16 protein n=1 Tax=Tenacibaculum xiamenense TaxID=1261553 RepID=UPI003895738E